ncbi:MAG TPA: tRNA uridine-5-carboxymethylaminomethyl(34) synthesis GTPase MnmE [Gammaproteobacteria bacterium]|nr:tRNA uridine-5-carboxymethylaminomethyl(34) synthesis GTPase MnmE [Gammaproteobacteria bacterium]
MSSHDTIAAIATATGYGGVGIIRLSGPAAIDISRTITGLSLQPRYTKLCRFSDSQGNVIDQGLAIYFSGPHSFTGEDVIELHGHGGPVVMNMLLQACLQAGARQARAGEFSERAFLNDKMDLTQAEAVADLIASSSEQAARAAVRSLQGEFSNRVQALTEQLIHCRMHIESAIDFPEEEIDFLADETIVEQIDLLLERLEALFGSAKQGKLLQQGMTVVIAGRPNAGKSSLMNTLSGSERSIVTDIPGTTRDILSETIQIDGLPVHLIDTAGLRHSDDVVEQLGVKKAWAEIATADIILLLIDSTDRHAEQDSLVEIQLPKSIPVVKLYNKIDQIDQPACIKRNDDHTEIYLSVKTGAGIAFVREHLKHVSGYTSAESGVFSARTRHIQALETCEIHIHNAKKQLLDNKAGELAAEELRLAQQFLSEITGEFSSDDLLGRIFTSFCIGK